MGIAPLGLGSASWSSQDSGGSDGAGAPNPVRLGNGQYEIEQGGPEGCTSCWRGMMARLCHWCNRVRDFFAGVGERAEGIFRRSASYNFSASSSAGAPHGSDGHQDPQPPDGDDDGGDVDIPVSKTRRGSHFPTSSVGCGAPQSSDGDEGWDEVDAGAARRRPQVGTSGTPPQQPQSQSSKSST